MNNFNLTPQIASFYLTHNGPEGLNTVASALVLFGPIRLRAYLHLGPSGFYGLEWEGVSSVASPDLRKAAIKAMLDKYEESWYPETTRDGHEAVTNG